MTPGQQTVRSLPQKTSFYDAHERRAYLRTVEVAARIVDDPSLVERGRAFLDRFLRADPHQRVAYKTWSRLLDEPAETIARALLADSEDGAVLRDTAPVFAVLPAPRPKELRRRRG